MWVDLGMHNWRRIIVFKLLTAGVEEKNGSRKNEKHSRYIKTAKGGIEKVHIGSISIAN